MTSEGDGGRASGGGTFAVGGTKEFEKIMLAEQERSSHPAPPQDVTSQVTDLQQMENMLQAERNSLVAELQSGRMRRVEKLHPPQSQKRQPRTSENDQQEGKHVVQGKSQIPSRSWPTSSCEILWRSDRTGGGGTAD